MLQSPISRSRPREDDAFASLVELAHQLGPGARLPRHAELLESFAVSKRTLDAALVRLEERRLVQRVQGSGIYVLPGAARGVAILIDSSFLRQGQHGYFWDTLIDELSRLTQAGERKIGLHFTQPGHYDESAIQEGLRQEIGQGRLKAMICIGVSEAITAWLEASGVCVVGFAGPARCTVSLDDAWMVEWGVRHLAAQGCKRIELWSPVPWLNQDADPYSISHRCLSIFKATLAELGLEASAGGTTRLWPGTRLKACAGRPGYFETDETEEEQGFRRAQQTFAAQGGDAPDGLISLNDQMTRGALVAIEKMGLSLGQELRVVTHANKGSKVLTGFEGELDLMEVDAHALVEALFQRVQRAVEGDGVLPDSTYIKPVPVMHTEI